MNSVRLPQPVIEADARPRSVCVLLRSCMVRGRFVFHNTTAPSEGAVSLEVAPMIETTPIPSPDRLSADFLVLLPRIQIHAAIVFRHIRCADTKNDKINETIAVAWKWFVRLAERGKDVNQFARTFIVLAVKAVRSGRTICGQERAKDVMNAAAQHRHGFKVESLPSSTRTSHENLYSEPHGQKLQDALEERLRENCVTSVPDQVAFRVDWPNYYNSLSARDRALAEFLSIGNSAKQAASEFGVSPSRVTQLRQRWHREWERCQDADAVRS